MQCKIIPEECIACGLCQLIAPSVFDYDDNGIVQFVDEPHATHEFIPKTAETSVRQAAKECPAHVIFPSDLV